MKNWIPALAFGLVFTSTAVLASKPHGIGGHYPELGLDMLRVMVDEIGLTLSQEESISLLVNEARLASAVDRERVAQLHHQIGELSRDDGQFDEAAVQVVADELATLMSRMAVDRAQLRWEVRQLLSAEQREQIDSIRRHARAAHFRFGDQQPAEL